MANTTAQEEKCIPKQHFKPSSKLSEMLTGFMLKWKIDKEAFKIANDDNEHLLLAQKTVNIDSVENLLFSIELNYYRDYGYKIELRHDFKKKCPMYQDLIIRYAFVVSNNRIFSLGESKHFSLNIANLTYYIFSSTPEFMDGPDRLIAYCSIVAKSNVRLYSNVELGVETHLCQNILTPCTGHESEMEKNCRFSYANDEESAAINRYRFSGEIPVLNVEKAMRLYLRCRNKLSRFSELNVICFEYLIYNLNSDNAINILVFAHKNGLEELSVKCVEYLRRFKLLEIE